MNLSSEPFPDPDSRNQTRSRRHKRLVPPLNDETRSELVEKLANRVSPTFDFFLFALLSGVVIGLAFLFNSHALLIIAALLAPIMSPIIGVSLAAAIGTPRFFFLSLAGVLVGCLLVAITGAIMGIIPLIHSGTSFQQPVNFASVSWDGLLVLITGVCFTAIAILKKEQKPVLPSAAIAYVLFSTAVGIGFDLGRGNFQSALGGGSTLGFYILTAAVIGASLFFAFGFRPSSSAGYVLPGVLLILLGFMVVQFRPFSSDRFLKGLLLAPRPSSAETNSIVIHTPTPTVATAAITHTLLPSKTPSPKPTLIKTPSLTMTPTGTFLEWVKVDVTGQPEARLRDKPGFAGKEIMLIVNGTKVKLLPGVEFKDNVYWAQVETIDGTIGWMVHTVLSTSTPTVTITPTQE